MRASSLSSVTTFAVDRMFVPLMVRSAVATSPSVNSVNDAWLMLKSVFHCRPTSSARLASTSTTSDST